MAAILILSLELQDHLHLIAPEASQRVREARQVLLGDNFTQQVVLKSVAPPAASTTFHGGVKEIQAVSVKTKVLGIRKYLTHQSDILNGHHRLLTPEGFALRHMRSDEVLNALPHLRAHPFLPRHSSRPRLSVPDNEQRARVGRAHIKHFTHKAAYVHFGRRPSTFVGVDDVPQQRRAGTSMA